MTKGDVGPILSFIAGLITSAILTLIGGIIIGILWKDKSSLAYWVGCFFGLIIDVIAFIFWMMAAIGHAP